MYLLAACALSFKPLFRMLAKSLHLDSLITRTGTSSSKQKKSGGSSASSISGKSETTRSIVEMRPEKMGVAKVNGVEKIVTVKEQEQEQVDGGFRICVTRTMTMDVEAKGEEGDAYVRENMYGGNGRRGFF